MSTNRSLENGKMAVFEYFMEHAVEEKNLKPVDITVWLAIFRLSNEEGVSVIDVAEILQNSGIKSLRRLKTVLQHLIDLELLKAVNTENGKESKWICLPLKKAGAI